MTGNSKGRAVSDSAFAVSYIRMSYLMSGHPRQRYGWWLFSVYLRLSLPCFLFLPMAMSMPMPFTFAIAIAIAMVSLWFPVLGFASRIVLRACLDVIGSVRQWLHLSIRSLRMFRFHLVIRSLRLYSGLHPLDSPGLLMLPVPVSFPVPPVPLDAMVRNPLVMPCHAPASGAPDSNASSRRGSLDKRRERFDSIPSPSCIPASDTSDCPTNATTSHRGRRYPPLHQGRRRHTSPAARPVPAVRQIRRAAAGQRRH